MRRVSKDNLPARLRSLAAWLQKRAAESRDERTTLTMLRRKVDALRGPPNTKVSHGA